MDCQSYAEIPPKRDYGRYFCIIGKKGGTTPPGPDEKSGPFFHAQNQEVNVYAR